MKRTDSVKYPRPRLRVRCERGIDPGVRQSCLNFAVWLRSKMEFPIRVVVYLKKDYQIKNRYSKELVSATFFAPYDKTIELYIRIATGDYEELVSQRGEIDALWAILGSIAHEIVHYQQWIEDKEFDETEAENKSEELLDAFADSL
ncbi:hypothetical protein [Priestia megaterium]|uniref:hypothetical protein n=1 Tax=Priestia megaterium TaxID=1404 RepID=UPI001D178115|nr:hypothetical protein [Priestia megaterium]